MYSASDKMAVLLCKEPQALQVASCFQLPLGVGEKTIEEVCQDNKVDTVTFLAIVNFCVEHVEPAEQDHISLVTLMHYLRQSHTFFFDFSLPMLRDKLEKTISHARQQRIPKLILQFFDEYSYEIALHMQHENELVFPYVQALLQGQKESDYTIEHFANQHRAVDDVHVANKLAELKNLIVKYYPQTAEERMAEDNQTLLSVLSDINVMEQMLAVHCAIEDQILLPAVRKLEYKGKKKTTVVEQPNSQEPLSEREKDVLIEVVKGLSNKEIADVLCISIHTVISHRKNISKKLNIHSTAGLTIYAIVNNLIDINSFN